MRFRELQENEALEVFDVLQHYELPGFDNKGPIKYCAQIIQTKIVTDGDIDKEEEPITKDITEYRIGKERIENVDTLKTKGIYLKNYNYIIIFTIARKWMFYHFLGIIKDISIYLKDTKDKKTIKKVKKLIKGLKNGTCNYPESFKSTFNWGKEPFEVKKQSQYVYKLIRKKDD